MKIVKALIPAGKQCEITGKPNRNQPSEAYVGPRYTDTTGDLPFVEENDQEEPPETEKLAEPEDFPKLCIIL